MRPSDTTAARSGFLARFFGGVRKWLRKRLGKDDPNIYPFF
jgi:hypothetical protein